MSRLRARFNATRRTGQGSSVLSALVRPAHLVIVEVGHYKFDKETTRLSFDLIDQCYSKDGSFSTGFSNNKNPPA